MTFYRVTIYRNPVYSSPQPRLSSPSGWSVEGQRLVPPADADAFVDWLSRSAKLAVDPGGLPPVRSADPDDDYLIALAAAERALLVSGDAHVTSLANRVPVRTPAEFLSELGEQ